MLVATIAMKWFTSALRSIGSNRMKYIAFWCYWNGNKQKKHNNHNTTNSETLFTARNTVESRFISWFFVSSAYLIFSSIVWLEKKFAKNMMCWITAQQNSWEEKLLIPSQFGEKRKTFLTCIVKFGCKNYSDFGWSLKCRMRSIFHRIEMKSTIFLRFTNKYL